MANQSIELSMLVHQTSKWFDQLSEIIYTNYNIFMRGLMDDHRRKLSCMLQSFFISCEIDRAISLHTQVHAPYFPSFIFQCTVRCFNSKCLLILYTLQQRHGFSAIQCDLCSAFISAFIQLVNQLQCKAIFVT